MKILFISSWFPYPPINGAKIRIYNLIRELSKNHEITLLAFARTIPIAEARSQINTLEQFCRKIEVVPAQEFAPRSFTALKGFFSSKPRSVVQTYSSEMAQLFNKYVNTNDYDVVIASEVGGPGVVSLLAASVTRTPVILDAIEISLLKDAYYNQSLGGRRSRNGLTWLKVKKFTRDVLRQANACTDPSLQEKNNILEIAPEFSPIEVIPHSLDLARFNSSFGHPRAKSLVFTGSFTYHANQDAAYFFLGEIYPRLKDLVPEAVIQIVGSTDGADLSDWPIDDSVTFTGLIKDVRPIVAQSCVSVVPLRMGAGTRLKIIESMALGTPVISTSKGAEGLEVKNGENILLADDADTFAQAINELIRNPGLREKLSANGRQLVVEQYSSEVMGQRFNSLLERVIY